MLITVKHVVITDGGYNRLWGMPFGFISNNLGCSGCYEVYVLAMLLDLMLKFIFVLILFYTIERLGIELKTHIVGVVLGCLVTAFWIFAFYMITFESRFKLLNDMDLKTLSWEFCWGLQNNQ